MSRGHSDDTTDVFRQKVTREGVYQSSRWYENSLAGQTYKTVQFYGPYRTRNTGGNPWLNAADTKVTVELQKLGAAEGGDLEWVTEKKRIIESESPELG